MLAYHGVGEVAGPDDRLGLVVSPDHLEEHVGLLRKRGYRFVAAERLLDLGRGERPPDGTATLTFDDGLLDGLTVAAPLLRRLGVPATFYVCTGWWGGRHDRVAGEHGRLLDAEQARALAAEGMELGSHTVSHPDLRRLDGPALARELRDSREAIERLTGRPCRTLAYPYGLSDRRVTAAARVAGYELAFGWRPGPWRRHAAPRLPAPARHGAGRLAKLLARAVPLDA